MGGGGGVHICILFNYISAIQYIQNIYKWEPNCFETGFLIGMRPNKTIKEIKLTKECGQDNYLGGNVEPEFWVATFSSI